VVVDYLLVFVGAILGVYALARDGRARRVMAYAGGVVLGLLPLLAFNWWAFGTPTHIAYEDYARQPAHLHHGFYGFGFRVPSGHVASHLLFSSMGLLTLTPAIACGVVGAVLLARRRRAEGLVVLAVVAVYLVTNSSLRYYSAFGGLGPPRYLIPLVPFAAVPLAVAFRVFPLTTIGLSLVSAFQMVVITATGPLAAYDGDWLHRFGSRTFVETGAALVGVTGWYAIVPYFVAVIVAVACGWSLTRLMFHRRELPLAGAALLGWAAIALTAGNPNGRAPAGVYVALMTLASGAVVLALWVFARARRPLAPMVAARSPR
jgi:hypothetical protein